VLDTLSTGFVNAFKQEGIHYGVSDLQAMAIAWETISVSKKDTAKTSTPIIYHCKQDDTWTVVEIPQQRTVVSV
jgi:hypothetical protein